MIVHRHSVFWQALLSTVLIFGFGIFMGIIFEQARNTNVENILLGSEVNVLDSQMIGLLDKNFEVSCEAGSAKIIQFADEIYQEAVQLEKYEESSQLTSSLEILHKRYGILRLILWQQAINLKKRCGGDYHTLVYFYQYNDVDSNVKAQQIAFSRFLENVKKTHGNKVILIPIAGDLGLNSVDLVLDSYDVESYPVVIFDEKRLFNDINKLEDINSLID